jgi:D-hydroxyproline dehydrogenase subunit gamma
VKRLGELDREPVEIFVDGRRVAALRGDTVLTAMLIDGNHVRRSEFSGEPRAGFCLMGACQDCWVMTEAGERVRACTTFVEAGMRFVTKLDPRLHGDDPLRRHPRIDGDPIS